MLTLGLHMLTLVCMLKHGGVKVCKSIDFANLTLQINLTATNAYVNNSKITGLVFIFSKLFVPTIRGGDNPILDYTYNFYFLKDT